jgi:hypothetical protein
MCDRTYITMNVVGNKHSCTEHAAQTCFKSQQRAPPIPPLLHMNAAASGFFLCQHCLSHAILVSSETILCLVIPHLNLSIAILNDNLRNKGASAFFLFFIPGEFSQIISYIYEVKQAEVKQVKRLLDVEVIMCSRQSAHRRRRGY